MGIALGVATLNGFLISTKLIAGLGSPFFGYLGDRHGREKVVALAIPVCMIGLVLLVFPMGFGAAIAWLPISFAAVSAAITALDSTVGGLAPPHRRTKVLSRYATWQDTGSAIGPLAAYAVLGVASLTFVYLAGAVVLAIALVMFLSVFQLSVASRS